MKKLLLALTVITFTVAVQAGDSCCSAKTTTAASKDKASCYPAMQGKTMQSTKAGTCPASKQQLTTSKDVPVKKQISPKELASK